MNEELMLKVSERVYEEDRWFQGSYARILTMDQVTRGCPSSACVCGWAVTLDNRELYNKIAHLQLLCDYGLDMVDTGLFTEGELSWLQEQLLDAVCRRFPDEWIDSVYLAWHVAGMRALDIGEGEAQYLFNQGMEPLDGLSASEALHKIAMGVEMAEVWGRSPDYN